MVEKNVIFQSENSHHPPFSFRELFEKANYVEIYLSAGEKSILRSCSAFWEISDIRVKTVICLAHTEENCRRLISAVWLFLKMDFVFVEKAEKFCLTEDDQ